MSEFHASRMALQAIYKQDSTYTVPQLRAQSIYAVEAPPRMVETSVQFMRAIRSPLQMSEVAVQYMRSARLKDMSKPLYLSRARAQSIYEVSVKAQVSKLSVLVLQNQTDQEIPPSQGGLFQARIY